MPVTHTTSRKDEHLDLCATGDVAPRENDALFGDVHLMHCALPELAVDEVSLSTPFLGKTLRAPLMMTGMTGGTSRASAVNQALAEVAEHFQIGFGVGSQRAMLEDDSLTDSFSVRNVAPTTLVLGNLGVHQLVTGGTGVIERAISRIGADGIAIHLNAAQELTQPEGDRDFRKAARAIEQAARTFGDRLIVKETGCGISPTVARRLVECGVKHIDVSGLGGTSWVRVEELRARGVAADAGAALAGWGIPTAAAVAMARRAVGPGITLVASGGIRNGLDVARSLVLGANLAGAALPFFRAYAEGGLPAVYRATEAIILTLRHVTALVGSKATSELSRASHVVTGELKQWLATI